MDALEIRITAHETSTNARLANIDLKLDHIASILDQGKGGWKALAIASTVIGAIGAAVWAVVSAIGHKIWP